MKMKLSRVTFARSLFEEPEPSSLAVVVKRALIEPLGPAARLTDHDILPSGPGPMYDRKTAPAMISYSALTSHGVASSIYGRSVTRDSSLVEPWR